MIKFDNGVQTRGVVSAQVPTQDNKDVFFFSIVKMLRIFYSMGLVKRV